jgi:hypothetical protein
MEPIVWLIIVVALVAIVLVAVLAIRARSHARLKERFGPEYDRAVERASSRRDAEQELSEVAHRRDQLEIKELDPQVQAQFAEEWAAIQARFVDTPAEAVASADALLTTVMEVRGYPVEDEDERTLLVAADHPEVIGHYREARQAHQRYVSEGEGDTEVLRQSFMHYRDLFEALVPPGPATADAPVSTPTRTAPPSTTPASTTPASTTPENVETTEVRR